MGPAPIMPFEFSCAVEVVRVYSSKQCKVYMNISSLALTNTNLPTNISQSIGAAP